MMQMTRLINGALKTVFYSYGKPVLCCMVSFYVLLSCNNDVREDNAHSNKSTTAIFKKLHPDRTNINFSNTLTENDTLNSFTYPYLYMGGGVSAGDINNDGLTDLFFSGNMVENKLYLNKGDLRFEDISKKAHIAGDNRWFTGTTMADVNNDGFLDIYCMVAGHSGDKANLLYINNGDNTFTEKAKEYRLADIGNSVDASFFDYDNDGDLDVYVANYPITPFQYNSYNYEMRMKYVTDTETDNLYRNDGTHFTKVTQDANLKLYSLSLSVTVSDLNRDGWPDIYVSNDFATPDCMYINNQDGTFTNAIKNATDHTSFHGMGVDIADFNNDGFVDILQMDMDASSNRHSKSKMGAMNQVMFDNIKNVGFQYQFMQNALQLNSGVLHKNSPKFSDISRLAGISSTGWSWAPLFADFDNDGLKDIFISNGTRKEINNKDYFGAILDEKKYKDSLLLKSLKIPSEKTDNYVYRNKGDLTFERANDYWGISHEGFSNGAVYADLDNDGDLEVVTNNIDEVPSIFENTSSTKRNFISLRFKGPDKNRFGLGTKVIVSTKKATQMQELTLSRGFQSSVDTKLHFGVGCAESIAEIKVVWPDGRTEIRKNIASNKFLELDYANAKPEAVVKTKPSKQLFDSFLEETPASYTHEENRYNDFKYEVLLPHKTSDFGPGMAVGDLNGDGRDDFYVGGANTYPGGLFFQQKNGSFTQRKMEE